MTSKPSTSGTIKHNNTNCCVYGCHSRKGKDQEIHFHYFPKANSGICVKIVNALGQEERIDKRKAWEKALLMGKPVTEYMRVCSKHFKNEDYRAKGVSLKQPKLMRFAVPSLNLPKKRSYFETKELDQGIFSARKERLFKRQKVKEVQSATISEAPLCEISDTENSLVRNEGEEIEIPRSYENLSEEEKVVIQNLVTLGRQPVCKFVDKEVQVYSGDIMVTFTSTIKEDKHLNSLTGISSFSFLNSLTTLVQKFYPDMKTHKLSTVDRIILVFMKLKMALKLNVLSFLFKISPSTCKLVFVEYVGIFSNILKSCIHWPPLEECQRNMPTCFKYFKTVRIVLDCLEIPIEKPKCLCCRVRTYSHYKGRQTLKIMTGVSPAGLITFVSKSYGGRSSDKAIFIQSNLINKLEARQDSIMVDKGFLIDDICQEYFIKLIRPHFLRKKNQFSESESKQNVLISKARVHIERVNQRMRIFNILNVPMPNTLIPLVDDILTIICGMVNLQTPVLADNRF